MKKRKQPPEVKCFEKAYYERKRVKPKTFNTNSQFSMNLKIGSNSYMKGIYYVST